MSSLAALLNQISSSLKAVAPSLTTASDGSDLYEAYIFGLILNAARAEGAAIGYRDINGRTPTIFLFRTSPGYLHSKQRDYCYATIDFAGVPALEAHVGVRVQGKSTVLHECDVLVLTEAEAEACRRNGVAPRSSKALVALECKYYSTSLPLGLARGFLGLTQDLSARSTAYVTNTRSQTTDVLLTSRNREWEHELVPGKPTVERFTATMQNIFKKFIAKPLS